MTIDPRKQVELIADAGELAARDVTADILARILKAMPDNLALDSFRFLGEARDILDARQSDLAAAITDADMTARAVGAANVANKTPDTMASDLANPTYGLRPPIEPPTTEDIFPTGGNPAIRFPVVEDAIATLNKSPVISAADFRETAEYARRGAFAITGELSDDTLGKIRDALTDNIQRGLNRQAFVDTVQSLFVEGSGLSDARLKMVFRDNVGTALSNGMERSLANAVVADAFPYRRYRATHDNRARQTHRDLEKLGLNGTAVYRADDPVWEMFRPPWDYGCRCAWSPISVQEAARLGVREAVDWMDRAKQKAELYGVPAAVMLDEVRPSEVQWVDMPPFQTSPEWRREQFV